MFGKGTKQDKQNKAIWTNLGNLLGSEFCCFFRYEMAKMQTLKSALWHFELCDWSQILRKKCLGWNPRAGVFPCWDFTFWKSESYANHQLHSPVHWPCGELLNWCWLARPMRSSNRRWKLSFPTSLQIVTGQQTTDETITFTFSGLKLKRCCLVCSDC